MEKSTSPVDSDRELTMTRVIDAPVGIVFLACSAPEHVKNWFGPKEWPLTLCEMDFRVGGKYRFQMTGPKGELGPVFGGEYIVIEPNKKISFSNRFEAPGSETMVMTFTLHETNGKTTFVHHTLFATPKMKREYLAQGMEDGLGSSLDLLVEVATRLARS